MTSGPDRGAVLLDLENLLHHDDGSNRRWPWVQGAAATNLLTQCLRAAKMMLGRSPDRVLAVACGDLMRHVVFLSPLRTGACRVVPTKSDAADHRLLDDATHLANIGFTRFVIGSGDHIFTDFAHTHETYVLARPGTLSHQLRRAAVRTALVDVRIEPRTAPSIRATA